jgi:hypothetical protein
VVNVEERPLRSFEEDALAVRGQIVQDLRYVRGDRRNVLRRLQRIIERFREIDRLRPKIVFQQEIVVVENLAELGRKLLAQEQVGHPQRTPGNLVFATCDGSISGQPGLTLSRSNTGTPVAISAFASATSASSDRTTPLPIRQLTPSRKIPEGIRCRTVFLPSMTSVCPAL